MPSNELVFRDGERDGNAVAVIPNKFGGKISRVFLQGPNGEEIASNYTGVANDDRGHFRFPGSKGSFRGFNLMVEFDDGTTSVDVPITDGGAFRQDFGGFTLATGDGNFSAQGNNFSNGGANSQFGGQLVSSPNGTGNFAAVPEFAGEINFDQALQAGQEQGQLNINNFCLLYTSPSPRDQRGSRMPSSA